MQDILRDQADLGNAVRQLRKRRNVTTVDLARQSGRSRDLIHRLETGRDVSVSALLDVLRALGATVQLAPLGMPTLHEVRERFASDDE